MANDHDQDVDNPYNDFMTSVANLFTVITSPHKPSGNGYRIRIVDEHLAAHLLALKQKLNLLDRANLEDHLVVFIPWSLRFLSESLQREEITEVSIRCRGSIISIINSAFNISDGTFPTSTIESTLNIMLQVLRLDVESNGISALHLIVDLHKKYRSLLEGTVRHVLDTAKYLLSRFEDTARTVFSEVLFFAFSILRKVVLLCN